MMMTNPNKKNVLIISLFYPPIQKSATNRIFSFAKYLSREKFNIYVIALDDGTTAPEEPLPDVQVFRFTDNSPIKKADFKRKANPVWHKLKAAYNVALSTFPQIDLSGWVRQATRQALELVENDEVDLIISSFPPAAPHLVALEIKTKHPDIPWIADMRDEMISPATPNKFEHRYLSRLQPRVVNAADAVVSVSQPILDDFRQSASAKSTIFREIRNGYDFEVSDLYSLEHNPVAQNAVFTIVYTGGFAGKRSPENFFKALAKLVETNQIKTQVDIYGVRKPLALPPSIKSSVTMHGKVDHAVAIAKMKSADLLLLVSPTDAQRGIYTGKLFEYLGALKPILGLVPEDDVAAQLIRDCNAGYTVDNDDLPKIEQALLTAYHDWLNGQGFERNIDLIKQHHRKEQARRLENLIDELLVNR